MSKAARRLTPKQAAFVREYLVDLNATQASVRAGYSAKTAEQQGPRLLGNVGVAAAIKVAIDARAQRTEITQDRVLEEIARVAFANIADLFDWDAERATFVPKADLTREQMAVISEIQSEAEAPYEGKGEDRGRVGTVTKLKLKTYDKLVALEKLAKHLGLFVERFEHAGKNGAPLVPPAINVILVKP
jgi:phage terminase small subunit